MSGKISISSSDVEETISLLKGSLEDIETNTSSYVNDNYGVLEELGLVDPGVATVKRQINHIVKSQTKVIKDLNDHLESYYETENEIVNFINGFDNAKEQAKVVDVKSDYENVEIENVEEGKNISKTDLVKFIKSLNPDVEKILLKNLEKNAKIFDTTVEELIFNPKKAGLLCEILKKLCGDTNLEIDVSNSIKAKNVQKSLLLKIATTSLEIVNGVLWASLAGSLPYMKSFAKKKNKKVEDLVYKQESREELLEGFRDLYVGKGIDDYTPTRQEIDSFRNYINNVADYNKTSPEQLLSNVNNIDSIKRGV
jgi:hypothetical protein